MAALTVSAAAATTAGIKIDLSPQDIDRALTIARGRDAERQRFHAPYIQKGDQPSIEQMELVTEFRRVVLLAEERASKGDRFFSYSTSSAGNALNAWRKRVSVIARVRFHPQNNYVLAPTLAISLEGHDAALIAVRQEPIFALPGARSGDPVPVMGAVVEGVFDATSLGRLPAFLVALDKRELGRASFNLDVLE